MLRLPRAPLCLRRAAVLGAAVLGVVGCGVNQSTPPTRSSATAPAPTSAAVGLEHSFIAVVKRTQPEVVQIQSESGLGSGVIFDAQGHIVTNAHVAGSAGRLVVTLADGRRFDARLVGAYEQGDLAVISIGAVRGIKQARFADSSKLAVGEIVLAEGNPLGLQSSVTDGIISALGRNVTESGGTVLPDVIQTSAAINPGNSGGALVDLQGKVVGIPTLAAADPRGGGAAPGIGFAIPSNTVRDIASQLIRYGRVVNSHRAALGVTLADSSAAPGALIVAVQPGGPAARAGLTRGDLIEKLNGNQLSNAVSLLTELARHQPGDSVTLSVTALNGQHSAVRLTLGQLSGS
jgi:S1-C subfamily serine protease